ncbi:MAG: cyclic pyranopterin monophosphate synthase MoaC [Lachnospiraceae bacterium]|jgi:cyclic pyranopterin phosphate synthase|nr:cyclic pyranopterin monophosphate synthase MoaC [Lachnospiraceae bacterium]
MGKIIAVCTSPRKGTQKTNIHEAELIQEYGLKGDAHAGKWHRQVSLLSYEQFEEFKKQGAPIEYGAFGENLLVEGYDFKSFPVGTRFKCNDVILEMTQIGKECHHGCAIRQTMGDCIMPREGVFARVLQGGTIREGDEMALMPKFTHFDEEGNAFMVDVGEKADTDRTAVAAGTIAMSRECFEMVKEGNMKKGDVLGVARIAGIMAAKKTAELIPLCHMLHLSQVEIQFELQEAVFSIEARCTAKTVDKTGVEMEALTGVHVALLTIYDMCKAVDRGMHMDNIRLLSKSGGKSGLWEAPECRTSTEES